MSDKISSMLAVTANLFISKSWTDHFESHAKIRLNIYFLGSKDDEPHNMNISPRL